MEIDANQVEKTMKNVDKTIIKETKYILNFVVILSVIMQLVFVALGRWDYKVLLGNILSGTAGVLNFFLMGLSVQKALNKDEKEAKATIKLSQTYRTFFLAAVLIIGFAVKVFNPLVVVIGIFFPRVAVSMRPVYDKLKQKGGNNT